MICSPFGRGLLNVCNDEAVGGLPKGISELATTAVKMRCGSTVLMLYVSASFLIPFTGPLRIWVNMANYFKQSCPPLDPYLRSAIGKFDITRYRQHSFDSVTSASQTSDCRYCGHAEPQARIMDETGAENTQGTQSTQVVQHHQYALGSSAEPEGQRADKGNDDVGDVICILVPMSPAARKAVIDTALRSPEHVLSIDRFHPTTRLKHPGADIRGIALRLSSDVLHPYFGFTFGRNAAMCDIVLDHDAKKRISNMHFRIYVHSDGFVMLEDMSTNGTIVDGLHLWAHKEQKPTTRLLDDGATVRVGSEQDWIDFKVCLPFREDEEEDRFLGNLRTYRERLPQHEKTRGRARCLGPPPVPEVVPVRRRRKQT